MKKIIFFFTLFVLTLHAYNQEIGFKEIDSWIDDNPEELVPIRIEFNNNIDCFKINHDSPQQNWNDEAYTKHGSLFDPSSLISTS